MVGDHSNMIIVTGGAGFIGSNLIKELNRRSISNIIIVDNVTADNEHNIKDLKFVEVISTDDFYNTFDKWHSIDTVFHEGAISSTTETNQTRIDQYNLQPSYWLIDKADQYRFKLSYASSASVYGDVMTFKETQPLNPKSLYAIGKMRVDQYAQSMLLDNPNCIIQGWRYFNVYGNNETHKKDQASPITKFCSQAKTTGEIKVFKGSENFLRDFVCVDDIVNIKLSILEKEFKGIVNLGTGTARSFLSIAEAVAKKYSSQIIEIDFPQNLLAQYQKYTCANTDTLSTLVGDYKFKTVESFLLNQ
jgi:ADP-L-glycero-D-manno-heptose 6-epimerase